MLFNALEGRKGVAGLKRKSLRQQRPQMSQTESGFIENNVTIIQRLKKRGWELLCRDNRCHCCGALDENKKITESQTKNVFMTYKYLVCRLLEIIEIIRKFNWLMLNLGDLSIQVITGLGRLLY